MTITVQLQRDVPDLGRVGQIVQVSQAHARNFLLPKGLAIIATAAVIAAAKHQAATKAATQKKIQTDQEKLKTQLLNTTVRLTGRANPQGKLFAALKTDHVVEALRKNFGVTFPSTVRMTPEALKTLGDHTVNLTIGSDTISFTVHIDHAEA